MFLLDYLDDLQECRSKLSCKVFVSSCLNMKIYDAERYVHFDSIDRSGDTFYCYVPMCPVKSIVGYLQMLLPTQNPWLFPAQLAD